MRTTRLTRTIGAGLGAVILIGVTVYAATSVTIGVGTFSHFEPFGGPARITTRSLSIAANEVLGWHQHPGIGAYTIVKSGTLTVEDGCGSEVVYPQGSAFIEPPGRVHRGRAGATAVETIQTFVVPAGLAFSVSVPQSCGAPLALDECRNNGWSAFTYPRTFANEGDCVRYVQQGRATGCTTPPGAPANLTISGTGPVIQATWSVPASGATSYVVRAGSAPGQSNYVEYDTGSTATALTASAPPGTYYVRVHARNACGLSGASNEFVLVL
ncbi:MAG TPA: cupin domain-containing protein [Vicinamibacterales bacterium]|nr:cupin domain-containing protein [Vicinamibacterales bacterium]